ncbi:fork head domain-containing protein [Cyathus striatus]|nr:fork head domain-containing protein [Cyathus striatus]
MLTLQEIYAVVATRFEWYKMNPKEGWKNSIRHNLSLNLLFRKKNRPITEPGKGHYWYIDISSGEGNKRLRKRRNKSSRVQDSIEDEDDEVDSIDEEMEGLGGSSPGPYDNIDPALLLESSLASASSSSRSLPSSGSSSSIGGRRGGSSGRRWTSPTSTAWGPGIVLANNNSNSSNRSTLLFLARSSIRLQPVRRRWTCDVP